MKRRQDPVHSQPAVKQFKVVEVISWSQRDRTCGKCGKVHEGHFRSTFGCPKCGKEEHYAKEFR